MINEVSREVSNVSWMDLAYCKKEPPSIDFVPNQETKKEAALARQWCDRCEVRAECLLYALLYRLEGYWGGTDSAQRRKLAARRNRIKCLVCRSRGVIAVTSTEDQLCLACGLSWPMEGPRARRAPAAPYQDRHAAM